MHTLVELARGFNQQYQETFHTKRRVFKAGKLTCVPTWQKIQAFLDEYHIVPMVYFSVLFDWQQKTHGNPTRTSGVNWYGSQQAFDIFKKHGLSLQNAYGGGGALATDRDKVIAAVQRGLRLLMQAVKTYKCGLVTRQVLIAQLPATFFAVDVFWPMAAESAPPHVVSAVNTERTRLMSHPDLWQAAQETYYDWHRFAG